MKLLIITAVEEYEKGVKHILNHSGVKSFSSQKVKGYKNNSDSDSENWFGASHQEIDSLIFFVFVEETFTEEICRRVEMFNTKQESKSNIHVAKIHIEKSV